VDEFAVFFHFAPLNTKINAIYKGISSFHRDTFVFQTFNRGTKFFAFYLNNSYQNNLLGKINK
jgi:hypothetical protein